MRDRGISGVAAQFAVTKDRLVFEIGVEAVSLFQRPDERRKIRLIAFRHRAAVMAHQMMMRLTSSRPVVDHPARAKVRPPDQVPGLEGFQRPVDG